MIAVIWHHVGESYDAPILNQGFRGVDFFFAISGFLITTLLLREKDRTGSISLKNFYIRRSFRIFPVYYVSLAVYAALTFLLMRHTDKAAEFWNNLPAFLTYTSNWFLPTDGEGTGITFYFAWSLATEEQFYLFWAPLLLLLLKVPKAPWLPACAALMLMVVSILAKGFASESLFWTIVSSLAPAILMGAAAATALHYRASFAVAYRVVGAKPASPLLALALIACLALEAPGLLVQTIMVLLVTSLTIREDTPLAPFLRWRPLVFVGSISYGMYLLHMLCANVVRRVLQDDRGIVVFLATLALVSLVAYLSFRYFESPLIRYAHKIAGASHSGPATAGLRNPKNRVLTRPRPVDRRPS